MEMKQYKSANKAKAEAVTFIKKFTVACIAAVLPSGGYRMFIFKHGSRAVTQIGKAENFDVDLVELIQNYPDAEVLEMQVLQGDFWLTDVIS
jgi:hypothetical protein